MIFEGGILGGVQNKSTHLNSMTILFDNRGSMAYQNEALSSKLSTVNGCKYLELVGQSISQSVGTNFSKNMLKRFGVGLNVCDFFLKCKLKLHIVVVTLSQQ